MAFQLWVMVLVQVHSKNNLKCEVIVSCDEGESGLLCDTSQPAVSQCFKFHPLALSCCGLPCMKALVSEGAIFPRRVWRLANHHRVPMSSCSHVILPDINRVISTIFNLLLSLLESAAVFWRQTKQYRWGRRRAWTYLSNPLLLYCRRRGDVITGHCLESLSIMNG